MHTSNVLKSRGGFIAIAVAALAMASSAQAGSPGADVAVRYADLDIATTQGATVLLKRIEGAAVNVCASLDHGDLASRAKRDSCEGKLTAAAVAKVNHPVLAAVYESSHKAMPAVASLAK